MWSGLSVSGRLTRSAVKGDFEYLSRSPILEKERQTHRELGMESKATPGAKHGNLGAQHSHRTLPDFSHDFSPILNRLKSLTPHSLLFLSLHIF